MAHLPSRTDELATRRDLDALGSRMSAVETRLSGVETGLVGVNQRLDRLFLTLLAGMLGVLTALAGAFAAGTLL